LVRCIGICQEDHIAALNLMLKVGYKKEGLMRKSLFKNGNHINQWLLSITDDDYAIIRVNLEYETTCKNAKIIMSQIISVQIVIKE